jgi:hypothetical protein
MCFLTPWTSLQKTSTLSQELPLLFLQDSHLDPYSKTLNILFLSSLIWFLWNSQALYRSNDSYKCFNSGKIVSQFSWIASQFKARTHDYTENLIQNRHIIFKIIPRFFQNKTSKLLNQNCTTIFTKLKRKIEWIFSINVLQ